MGLLEPLLVDRTTGRNILWASDAYLEYGNRFARNEPITAALITGEYAGLIRTRARKAFEQQSQRTKQRAEVFTPLWIVEKMNDHLDEAWFQRKDGIHKTDEQGQIAFNTKKTWQQYVENRRLEITCGEGPFLVSRYDAATGEVIPPEKRVGLLDRKLRAVGENTDTVSDWLHWSVKALRASYGYEFQGDSLLISRINVIMSVWEAFEARWGQAPTASQLRKAVETVTWNLWQMDGLTDRVPYARENLQLSLFDLLSDAKPPLPPYCRIKNWRQQRTNQFRSLKGERTRMKFDYIIGNPPYQEEQISDNFEGSLKNYAPPIYNRFMDECFMLGNAVELIHPARFLFNAGSTPKAWNEKMLADSHFKVLYYEEDGHKVFPTLSTPLRGGVAITYRDADKEFGALQAFTKFPEVNGILHKVIYHNSFKTIMDIVYSRTAYRLTDTMHIDHPEARYKADEDGNNIGLLSKGHDYDMSSNIMSLIPAIFHDAIPDDGKDYIQMLGRINNRRIYKYIRRDYVKHVDNLDYYKVYVAQANGSGEFGETMSEPVVEKPGVGSTETFLSIGKFKTIDEGRALEKYIKTKFARALLSVLKVTQNGNKPVWKYVPLQDFTPNSDIDWSQSVADIDRQLYAKYGLDEKEIEFIETHVKEMA